MNFLPRLSVSGSYDKKSVTIEKIFSSRDFKEFIVLPQTFLLISVRSQKMYMAARFLIFKEFVKKYLSSY